MISVERRPLDTSRLVTVDEVQAKEDPRRYVDQYVRLQPTAAATDEELKAVKQALIKAGARAVKVLPKPPSDTVALSAVARKVQQLSGGGALPPIRELCDALVDVSASQYKAEVKALLGELADRTGQ